MEESISKENFDKWQRAAFLAGFLVSAEGWNSEYPYNCDFEPDEFSNFDLKKCASDVLEYYSSAVIERIMKAMGGL